jgi:hypothetical protein
MLRRRVSDEMMRSAVFWDGLVYRERLGRYVGTIGGPWCYEEWFSY